MSTDTQQAEVEERIFGTLKLVIPIVVLVGMLLSATFVGVGAAVLTLAAGALIGAIAAFWASLRAVSGDTRLSGEDAFALGAPSAEEEQKRAVLRAIKDLEFEHSVGKISEYDYRVLMFRYRAEAKRLLRVLDNQAAPAEDRVEELVRAYLAEQGLAPGEAGAPEAEAPEAAAPDEEAPDEEAPDEEAPEAAAPEAAAPEAAAPAEEAPAAAAAKEPSDADEDDADAVSGESAAATIACPACDAANDADAVFCKKCGKAIAASSDAEPEDAEPEDADSGDDDAEDDDEGEDGA